MVSGIITSASGISSSIFGFLTTGIANPDDEKRICDPPDAPEETCTKYFDTPVSDNVPQMLRICVYIWLALAIIGCGSISRNPEYTKKEEAYAAARVKEVKELMAREI